METINKNDTEIKYFLTGKSFTVEEGQSLAPFTGLIFSIDGNCTYGKMTEKFDIKDGVLLIGTGGLTLKYPYTQVNESSFKIKTKEKEFLYIS
ncbi:MAG: hypothetical protein SFY56_05465 [Bacteroidota bacterium]|nr:hypothetical protein [Bacteroidota bacterium]